MEENNNPVVKVKSPYFNIRQGFDLCFPTMTGKVFFRKDAEYNHEELAAYMGVYVSEDNKNSYSPILRSRALPKVDKKDPITGKIILDENKKPIKVDDARVGFNLSRIRNKRLVEKLKYLGLEISSVYPSELGLNRIVTDPSEFTKQELKIATDLIVPILESGNDIGINYRLDDFRGTESGHYVLISSINKNNYDVEVSDSSPASPPEWRENLGKFLFGMQPIWREDDNKERERGFIIFKGPKKLKTQNLKELLRKSDGKAPKYIPVAYEITPKKLDPKDFPKPTIPQDSD